MTRIEKIGPHMLYLGDNREILPTLGLFDACLTDPPYGIRADEKASAAGKSHDPKFEGLLTPSQRGWVDHGETTWDRERPPKETFEALLACAKHQIIWGGNYFTDYLPPTMQWLIWDKGQRDFSLADFEMAWSSQNKASRIKEIPRSVALQDGKVHPTQKPVALMQWCLDLLPSTIKTVVDPFMGSGTTGVAAASMGRIFTGIEREEKYFDICCRRIAEASKQEGIF